MCKYMHPYWGIFVQHPLDSLRKFPASTDFHRSLRLKEDLDSNWKAGHNAFLGRCLLREGEQKTSPKSNTDTT